MRRNKDKEIKETYKADKRRFSTIIRFKHNNFTCLKKGTQVLWTKIWSPEEIGALELFNH